MAMVSARTDAPPPGPVGPAMNATVIPHPGVLI